MRDLKKKFNKVIKNFNKSFEDDIEEIQKMYTSDIVKAKEDLLVQLCNDYDLKYDELHKKYIQSFKKTIKSKKSTNQELIDSDNGSDDDNVTDIVKNEPILEKKEINNIVCYVEDKEGGNIYNQDVEKVGEIRGGEYVLY